jgi:probable phosphoglycerate mutase
MPVSTVYLLRHGDCRRDDISRYCGHVDPPLNKVGVSQALAWRQQLSDVTFSRVVCSDLCRSRETARLVGGGGAQPEEFPALREIDMGVWDGRPMAEIRREFPDDYACRGREMATFRPPGGESFADLAERVLPLFLDLVRGVTGDLLLVGHAGVNRVILCHLLGMPLANLFRIGQEYGCLNLIHRGRSAWCVRAVNIPASRNGD